MESFIFGLHPWRGELAALGAACLWAASSVVYSLVGQRIPPLTLNFLKGAIAIVLIALTLLLTGAKLPEIQPLPATVLLLSGAVGIGLGDTAYFAALNILGARRTLLLETLAPPLAALFALIFLAETLSSLAWCGIFLTVLGVAWVIAERTSVSVVISSQGVAGIVYALIAAFAQASGAVLSRFALANSAITPLWSTLLRLLAGTAIVWLLLLWHKGGEGEVGRWGAITNSQSSFRLIGVLILTAFGSTYLGIWLQQTALKFAPAGIAQTLIATSPLFVLPLAVCMGDRVSLRAILGVLLAIAGIGLLFS